MTGQLLPVDGGIDTLRRRDERLAGKVVLLTGASGGIGAVTARALGRPGADLIAPLPLRPRGRRSGGAPDARASAGLLVQGRPLGAGLGARALARGARLARADRRRRRQRRDARPDTVRRRRRGSGTRAGSETHARQRRSSRRARSRARRSRTTASTAAARSSRSRAGRPRRGSAIPQVPRLRRVEGRAAQPHADDRAQLREGRRARLRRRARHRADARCPRSRPRRAAASTRCNAMLAMGEMVPPEEVAELVAFLATGSCRHLTGATLDMNGADVPAMSARCLTVTGASITMRADSRNASTLIVTAARRRTTRSERAGPADERAGRRAAVDRPHGRPADRDPEVVRRHRGAARGRPDGAAGEHVVIFGPSGSGKSTVLRTINLLEQPTAGSVRVMGVEYGPARARPRRRRAAGRSSCGAQVGMVFQQFNLFPHLTALDNVALPLRSVRKAQAARRPRSAPPRPAAGRACCASPPTTRASCPAASSSASRSPAR